MAQSAAEVISHSNAFKHVRRNPLPNVGCPQWGGGSRRHPHAVELRRASGVRFVVHALRALAARRHRLFNTRTAQHANGRVEGLQRRLVQTRFRCYEGTTEGDGKEDCQPPQHLLLRATWATSSRVSQRRTPLGCAPFLAMVPSVQPYLSQDLKVWTGGRRI